MLKIGNSYAISFPRNMLEDISLRPGDWTKVSRLGQEIVITKAKVDKNEDTKNTVRSPRRTYL